MDAWMQDTNMHTLIHDSLQTTQLILTKFEILLYWITIKTHSRKFVSVTTFLLF